MPSMPMSTFKLTFFLVFFLISENTFSYWQQKVEYKIKINFDHKNHQFEGEQKII